MKRIYEVEFEERWIGCHWVADSVNVCANGDMYKAIEKARKHRLSQHFKGENNKVERCVGFRALGVKVLAEAEI